MEVFQGVNRLRDLIRREDVDLVHTNTLAVLSAALAAKLTQRKHIWHVHEFLATHAHIRKFLHWMAVRFSDRVVTVSNAVRQHILRDQPEACDSIVTLYNGIRLEPLLNLQTEPILRREFNIPPNAPVVGMVGRVSRWKGQSLLVEAAKIVQEVRPDVHFIAVGGVFDNETHYMDDFLRLVRERGLQQFHISDFRKDIPQVLASYDLFVLPSLEPDPFPTVIVEAQASAKPVVGAAHGGVPEMIIDGATGLLFRPNDPHDLAEKLLSLLDHPAEIQRMSAAARERALSAFQISRFAREFQDLYSSVLEEHAS
jgi:glycosyltransferase involved in cell wall biosynthesis